MTSNDVEITDVIDKCRYVIVVDGEPAGYAEYEQAGNTRVFTHTVTVPSMRGRGIAAQVVRCALDDARTAGMAVVPRCWYVAKFIDAHPEYADLLPTTSQSL